MIAIDTNVLIYACDQADPRRQNIALVSNSTPWNPRRSVCIAYLVAKPYISSTSGRRIRE